MRCGTSFPAIALALLILPAVSGTAMAQADAQQAFQQGKAAYEAKDFAKARDSAFQASQTDPGNAEVFLLLGKARYQLGELAGAIEAWKRTLELAPQEPYAARMFEVLQAGEESIDGRIRLVELLVAERLYDAATQESSTILSDEALSGAQRAKVWELQIEIGLAKGRADEALRTVDQLRVREPDHVDPVKTMLWEGQAKLRLSTESQADGIVLLEKLAADHPDTESAATAQFELIRFQIGQGVDAAPVDALAAWVAGQAQHPQIFAAKRTLVDAYLALSQKSAPAGEESELSQEDREALAVAAELYQATVRTEEALELTERIVGHLQSRYADRKAFGAAVDGAETLLATPLPSSSRLRVLHALAAHRTALAIDTLAKLARKDQLEAGPEPGSLPKLLVDAIAVRETIRGEFPAEPTWGLQVSVADEVRKLAAHLPKHDVIGQFALPDLWAIEIALPAIPANTDDDAINQAVDLVLSIVNAYAEPGSAEARESALAVSRRLLQASEANQTQWVKVATRHVELLDTHAKYQYQENLRTGNTEANQQLSEIQTELLAVLAGRVARVATYAQTALQQVGKHLEPWTVQGQWDVAHAAYGQLAAVEPAKAEASIAIVTLWMNQAQRQHQALLAAGLSVPRQLNPLHVQVLKRCCELQGTVADNDPQLARIRAIWDQVVGHYKRLKYFDIAEEAIKVTTDEPVDVAVEYAEFQLGQLKREHAGREFQESLKQYGAEKKISLTPAFVDAITAFTTFIADRPTSRLAPHATEAVFAIARQFESRGAHNAAAEVYRDLAEFAADVSVLSVSMPGAPSVRERAAMAAASALDAEAREALGRQLAERSTDQPPPIAMSGEHSTAIAAYKEFLQTYPESELFNQVVNRIMAIALQYASADAWDVASLIYQDLLGLGLDLRQPERFQFCQALCALGRAMPDHAREILAAITSEGVPSSTEGVGETMLAGMPAMNLPAGGMAGMGGMMGGGGFGGGAGAGAGAGPGMPQTASSQPAPDAQSTQPADQPQAAESPAPQPAARPPQAERDARLLAMIHNTEANRAAQVAQLRESAVLNYTAVQQQQVQQAEQGQAPVQQRVPPAPVLSDAEVAQQDQAISAAYDVFQNIRKDRPRTAVAEQARGEIFVMVGHWRTLTQWQRAAALAERFLSDHPTDRELPKLRLDIARDRLAWASKPIDRRPSKQEMMAQVSQRFEAAREGFARVVSDFPEENTYKQEAQWDVARSFLTQARVVDAFSPTLARGQYVRAARELRRVAAAHSKHPQVGQIPQMLWSISQELETRGYNEEAILVWSELRMYNPMHDLAQQASLKIAQTYHTKLRRPLRAVEAYQELNFARGGGDEGLQNAIFQIGSELNNEKRWVEALHVLESFVESFPRHAQAGQALTMIGHIHQTNEAWEDAIAAYRRVANEFSDGQWVQEAKWAIAECTINLSQWRGAADSYRAYVQAYAEDARVEEANRRVDMLKDLARYQALVDEEAQRKAFDAQFQIARIVAGQLANPVKAIIEYRKVVSGWPQSHLADDALYEVGNTYISLEDSEKARGALRAVAEKYPTSPLADDALFLVGKSYESEADKLTVADRSQAIQQAKEVAQRQAYDLALSNRKMQQETRGKRIASLKKAGKGDVAALEEASQAANYGSFNETNVMLFAQQAVQAAETLTATQMADREDKINAALRQAVEVYQAASQVAAADKADDALLQMATIYDQRLKDSKAAMDTWLEIVRQFSGTAVAEDASWRIADYYEREQKYAEAIEAFKAFLRNYRRSPKAGDAQFSVAENYEHLGEWVSAMDAYTNYFTNFPDGPLVEKAKDQINWIKTYRL